MQPFTLIVEDIKTLQRGIPTPNNYVPIENYIKIANYGWFKQIIDEDELQLLKGG